MLIDAVRAVMDHYLKRHREVSARLDEYSTPGRYAPAVVHDYQNELRGIEAAIIGLVKAAYNDLPHALYNRKVDD